MKSIPSDSVTSNPVDKIVRHKFESNRILVIAILVVTVVLYFFSSKAGFEKDMYSMNFLSKKMKSAEKNLFKISDISLKSVYVASTGKDLDQALAKNATAAETLNKLRNENIVKKYTDVGIILVNDSIQKERIKRWKDYWSEDRRKQLENTMIRSGQKLGFRPDAFSDFYKFIARDIQPVSIQKFDKVRSLFLNDMITETHDFTMVLSLVKVNDEDRHKVFTAFAGNSHTIVIDRQEITSGFVKDIKTDFDLLVKLCLILVSLIVIIAYGRLETGIIASIPMYISWIWTLGFMGMFGIKFNIINIIVTTFIFGLGVDYSILMMRGLSLEYKFGHKDLTSFKTSVFLSAFTTVVGVGVLMLAKHPSLNSIALISVFGLLAVVLISYTIVPILFRWLISKKGQKRLLPITLSDILVTIFVFSLALAASFSLNLLFLILKVLPLKTKAKKLLLHRGIVFWSGITVYTMLHVRKNIVNPEHEDFRKPAMIISNHQSHIDLLLLMMLYPRMIVLTTRWVWNNPIYALVIRYLDFYPVMEGYWRSNCQAQGKNP